MDNSEINETNVDSLIVLKDSDKNGSAIQFDATIDSSNTVLKIDPSVDFTFSQKVFLSISGVEDNGDNTLSGLTSITFTTVTNVPPTAINQTVKLDEDGEVTAGNFVWRPSGSRHSAHAPDGALILAIFLKPNRFYNSDGSQTDMLGRDYDTTWG